MCINKCVIEGLTGVKGYWTYPIEGFTQTVVKVKELNNLPYRGIRVIFNVDKDVF